MHERRQSLLNRAVSHYIETAEPVASNSLKAQYDLAVSSATVRSELNALEKDGYLIQPHTSSGRIPTSKGYRYYVDHMLLGSIAPLSCLDACTDLDSMVAYAVNQISSMGYVSVYSELSVHDEPIHHIQIVQLDAGQYVFMIVFRNGRVFEHRFSMTTELDTEVVSALLTSQFMGTSIYDVDLAFLAKVLMRFEPLHAVLKALFQGIQAAQSDLTHHRIVDVFGVSTVLTQPEFQDVALSRKVFTVLDDRKALTLFLGRISSEGHSKVVIGQENDIENLQDCSIVVTPFVKGRRPVGVLGGLGPTRMMYATLMPFLKSVKHKIESFLLS